VNNETVGVAGKKKSPTKKNNEQTRKVKHDELGVRTGRRVHRKPEGRKEEKKNPTTAEGRDKVQKITACRELKIAQERLEF